ncbi:hypothetical protein HDU97_000980 [Phlyctochytrium planicorne]|nr:hypothetical protein HDU97_000980 [Phlyctochytrium planicorne]
MPVQTSKEGGVLRIALDNPKRANALSAEMCSDFLATLDQAESDPSVRVVVLTGTGKYFCSGMDLANASSNSSSTPFESSLHLFERLANFPKPTIARLNGPALGGGVGLAFCCDFRCAVNSTFFQLAEVRRGLIPAIISLRIVPELGTRTARRWFLTGEKVECSKLVELGVVDASSANEEALDGAIKGFTDMLREGGPQALTTIKELVRVVGSSGTLPSEKTMHVKKVFEGMLVSSEAAEGMSAFIQKQKPSWAKL